MRRKLYFIIALPFILILISWLVWYFQPKVKINVLIMDKSVLTQKGNEHRSFNWILTHLRFVNKHGLNYDVTKDYWGFFPVARPKFDIRDLDHYTPKQLDSIAYNLDMVYFTDTYGIYDNEWYHDTLQNERSKKIYGGLTSKDVMLLKQMKLRNKLIVTEFNLFASPTSSIIRNQTEHLLGVKWTGWVGRFFNKLDTVNNADLPKWAIRLYKKQYKLPWRFKDSGIIFVNDDDRIVVLEYQKQLQKQAPYITTVDSLADEYSVIKKVHYPFWFDITYPSNDSNIVMSNFEIFPNKEGDSLMKINHVPTKFPAIIKHKYDNNFYYFCADFADNPIPYKFSYFEGIRPLSFALYRKSDQSERMMFFWEFYIPLMEHIMKGYLDTTY